MTEVTTPPSVPDPTTGPDRVSAPADYDAQTTAFRIAQRAFALVLPTLAEWLRSTAVQVEDWASTAESAASAASAVGNYQGEYDAGTTYAVGESVTKSPSTSTFVAKTINTGVTPVDGVNWLEVPRAMTPEYTGDVEITGKISATSIADTIVTLTGATPTIDLDAGGEFELTTSGPTTFTFSNPPDNSRTTTKTIRITWGGEHAIIWPTHETVGGVVIEDGGSGETKEFILRARTSSGGTTVYILTDVGILA